MKKKRTTKLIRIKSSANGVLLRRIFLFACILLGSLPVLAQASGGTVSLKLSDATLSEAFREIRKQANVHFIYSDNELDKLGTVTLEITDVPVRQAVERVIARFPLQYEIDGNSYIITPRRGAAVQGQTPAAQQPQRKTITGRITDAASGLPLAGATVMYQAALIGTTADSEGRFKLEVPEACTELAVSFLGYEPQTISVVGRSEIAIALAAAVNEVEQIVVTGYFNKDKDSFTGAVTSVKREDLRQYGSMNMVAALQMIDPSVKIRENNQTGSDPNALPDFFVRGESSFMGSSNLPTFMVDGYEVPVQRVFDMDVDRIESITILKDASATILYGSRAANGVIVIETRKPEGGKFRVSYNNRTSLSIADLSDYDLMNARQKMDFENEAGIYDLTNIEDLQMIEYIKHNVERNVDTDWIAQPVRNAVSHAHSVYLEGGGDYVVYGLGGNYNRNGGVMKDSHRETYGLSFDLTYRLKDKLSIRNSFEFAQTHVQNSPFGSFSLYTKANPYNPIYDDEGNFIKNYPMHRTGEVNITDPQYNNPVYNASLPYKDEEAITSITNNLNIDYYFTPDLRLRGSVALMKTLNGKDKFISPDHSTFIGQNLPATERGSYRQGTGKDFSYNINLILSYSLTRGKNVLFAGAGLNMVQNQTYYNEYTAVGFLDGRFNEVWFGSGFLPDSKPKGEEGKDRMIGAFANVNYAYDGRYFIDLSARLDGSSKFGADKRFAPFFSAGIGWNLHNELFLKQAGWLTRLRLRGSVGTTGNQNFEPYLARTTLKYDPDLTYYEAQGASFIAYGNNKLKWQSTLKRNVGIDLEVLDRRIALRVDYYYDTTDALLLPVSVTPSLGFMDYTDNLGEQTNRGLEFDLTAVIVRNKEFDWAVNVSGTRNTNKITKISNALRSLNDINNTEEGASTKPIAMYEEGESINAIKVVRSLGINPATGRELFLTRFGTITEEWDYRDKIVAGSTDPTLEGMISSNFMWKNFTLALSLRYSFGSQLYNSTLAERVEGADPRANADLRVLNERWRRADQRSFYKDIADRTVSNATSRFVQDNDYLEFSNISLSYRIDADWLHRAGITQARVGLNSNNLFHLSTIRRERGLDYPFARQFTFSLNLIF